MTKYIQSEFLDHENAPTRGFLFGTKNASLQLLQYRERDKTLEGYSKNINTRLIVVEGLLNISTCNNLMNPEENRRGLSYGRGSSVVIPAYTLWATVNPGIGPTSVLLIKLATDSELQSYDWFVSQTERES